LARLLVGLDVFLVGCTAIWPRSTPGTRPGDCRIGEGQSHVETDLIHTFGPYDFEVDTTNAIASAVAKSVLAAWRTRNRERGLWQGN
jgi:chloramphenicol 3-O phosphotransferase